MEKIKRDNTLKNEDERIIMGIMAQEYHFNPSSEGIALLELREISDYTDETIRVELKKLFERRLIEKVKSRPVKYIVSKSYLEN